MIGVGQELGGYTIIKRIGGGGLGEVFLAQHRRVNRRVAVKVLLPELAQKASVLEQFFKEARNTSLIRHPGIVEILDCDLVDGQPFVITEFLEGESLSAYLGRVGTLEGDLAFLLGVMWSVAGAVGAAHRAGIMHRDLKPQNIYLHLPNPADPAVTVKVLDFGIAKLSREDGGPSQTKTGLWLATPTYMSPEQCRGVGRPDERSDVYSLGCVFYEALCGKPPFDSPAIADLILAHLTQPPKPPLKQIPELPPKVNALVLRMLAKKPEERPQTMEQVVTTLRECARALGIDVEGQLLPLAPVERPTALLGAALAGIAPKPTAQSPLPMSALPLPLPSTPLATPSAPTAQPIAAPVKAAPEPAAAAGPVFSAQAAPAPQGPGVSMPRVVPPTQVAPERAVSSATPAPAVGPQAATPAARQFPRTLIAGAAERQAMGEGRMPEPRHDARNDQPRPAGKGEARIEALVGGTMVLEQERPARPAQAAPTGKIRPQIGGTQIMEPPSSAADDPDESEEQEDHEDESAGVTAPPHGRVGGEHTMRLAAEGDGWTARLVPLITGRGGLVGLGVVAVVALAIVMIRLLAGGPPAGHKPVAVEPPTAIEPPPSVPTSPPEPPVAVRPATVTIDIQGLSPDTEVLVDDQLVTLPTRVPRGPELHRFTLRPPHGAERTIEIDGSRDRVVELVMAPEGKAAHPPAARPAHAPVSPSGSGAVKPSARTRPAVAPDRNKAITDL